MPKKLATDVKTTLYLRGKERVSLFCRLNGMPCPAIFRVKDTNWYFDACAFYRPDDERTGRVLSAGESKMRERGYGPGINICVERCAFPATEGQVRNWNWPGSVTDRTPFGVLAHELGHHADYRHSGVLGLRRSTYGGEYSGLVRKSSGEPPITSYCPDDGEWFAEVMRVFVTNGELLRLLRPRAYRLLRERWSPVPIVESLFGGPEFVGWEESLGPGVPPRIVSNLRRKIGAP